MLFTRWRLLNTWKNQKNIESHSHINVHDEKLYRKNMESHLHSMCMKKTHIKINSSHLYRNVHDENPFKKKWQSFVQKCAWAQSIEKEMVVIRTEM